MPSPDRFAPLNGRDPAWLTSVHVPAVLLQGAALPQDRDGVAKADIRLENGCIAAIEEPGDRDGPVIDCDGSMIWPGFVDMHTHLDKGHIWPRRRNPDGTFTGALENVGLDRAANWSAADVRARAEFALRSAYAHGTTAIRTHLDSIPPQEAITWPVFEELRSDWSGRIALQGVSLFGIERAEDPEFVESLADRVKAADGILGAVPYMVPDLRGLLETVFRAASARGLDLDFHVDESLDPGARSLEAIADIALDTGFEGRIVCGHCCSLAILDAAHADRIMDKVARAGIAIVSLPMCNLYLQDRVAGRTPRQRGVTLISELRARGIPVAVASDNTRDPFYAYGDLDGLEVIREAVRIGHLDHPVDGAPALITRAPADIIGLADHGRIAAGKPADLVIFDGRGYTEVLARPEANRIVLRGGRAIDRTLPDYRELDPFVGAA